MKTLLLGDLHNRREKTASVLRNAGVMDHDGNRVDGFRVVQLGDALSLGYDEVEHKFFTWLQDWVDLFCLGNHELPAVYFNNNHTHLGWDPNHWHGWRWGRDLDAEAMVRRKFLRGEYVAATSIGPWLVTHAGLMPKYQREHDLIGKPVAEVAEFINQRFEQAMLERKAPAFLEGHDSIFWVRIGELVQPYTSAGPDGRFLPQICGHTPSSKYGPKELVPGRLWMIDTPPVHHRIHGGVAGLLFDENDEIERMIYEP